MSGRLAGRHPRVLLDNRKARGDEDHSTSDGKLQAEKNEASCREIEKRQDPSILHAMENPKATQKDGRQAGQPPQEERSCSTVRQAASGILAVGSGSSCRAISSQSSSFLIGTSLPQ
jgi:hypothetical protein